VKDLAASHKRFKSNNQQHHSELHG